MALSDDRDATVDRSSRSPSESGEANAGPYEFDESDPRFRVFVGSERRPTGFLIRAPDETEARRQLMIAAIRMDFDRRGEEITLERVNDPETVRGQ